MNSFPAYITLLYNVNERFSYLKKKKKSLDRIIKALDGGQEAILGEDPLLQKPCVIPYPN